MAPALPLGGTEAEEIEEDLEETIRLVRAVQRTQPRTRRVRPPPAPGDGPTLAQAMAAPPPPPPPPVDDDDPIHLTHVCCGVWRCSAWVVNKVAYVFFVIFLTVCLHMGWNVINGSASLGDALQLAANLISAWHTKWAENHAPPSSFTVPAPPPPRSARA